MDDPDEQKKLFHCALTNCPGTNGALGSITPELLVSMFSQQEKRGASDVGAKDYIVADEGTGGAKRVKAAE